MTPTPGREEVTATRPTTTTTDHTEHFNSHHHGRASRPQSNAAPPYVADQSSAA
ncbi:hypothetical protein ACQPYE_26170 [Actinosynnema sp. CA-299493]